MSLTLGTAGHIDHGKTTLVEALTGKNTDRLPQEQARGISIDLGYAPLELPDGRRLSVIDVPGHERFVRTMIAGATGIDLFLRGIGAVVTGTLWSGSIGDGDGLRIEPLGRDVRVRSVQVHDRPVARAEAGQRVAVSLPGVERAELRRGEALVAPRAYPVSYRLDVALEPLGETPARVHVHHGTADIPARVARAGDGYAQLRLAEPIVAARGDRGVLR